MTFFFCSAGIFPPWPWLDVFFFKRLKITHINSAVSSNNPKVNYTLFIWHIFQERSTYLHRWKKRRPPLLFFGLPFIFDCVGVKLWHPLFSGCHSQGPTSIHWSANLVQLNNSKNTQFCFKMSTIDACEQSRNFINNAYLTHDHLLFFFRKVYFQN